jgi:hypothetical protein
MPNIGIVEMEDAESGEIMIVDTKQQNRLNYEKHYHQK